MEKKLKIGSGRTSKIQQYQCWMRNWETMEYVAIYVTARSTVEVAEVVNKHFRSTHQLKSIISEDEGFIPELAGKEIKKSFSDMTEEEFNKIEETV